jgi:hypothetical protein
MEERSDHLYQGDDTPGNTSTVEAFPTSTSSSSLETNPEGANAETAESDKNQHHGLFGWLFHSKKHHHPTD